MLSTLKYQIQTYRDGIGVRNYAVDPVWLKVTRSTEFEFSNLCFARAYIYVRDVQPVLHIAWYNSPPFAPAPSTIVIKPTALETTGAGYLAIQIIGRARAPFSVFLLVSLVLFSRASENLERVLACAGVVLHVPLMRERRIKHTHEHAACASGIRVDRETVLLIRELVRTGCITLSHRPGIFLTGGFTSISLLPRRERERESERRVYMRDAIPDVEKKKRDLQKIHNT